MIAATDILIDGDTAWWVVKQRPDYDGTGRHAFDIEVNAECDCYTFCIAPYGHNSTQLRVHVVEVLPIQATDDGGRLIHWDVDSEEFWLFESASHDLADLVVLPESAAPGMYAVRLRVKV